MFRGKNLTRYLAKFLATSILTALVPVTAFALDLGTLHVYSGINAPLDAEIGLASATEEEVNSLVARIAPPQDFADAGIELKPLVSKIKVTVVKRAGEQYLLQLRSEQPLGEPFLQFVLEATWSGGRVVREYAALLDPTDVAETTAEEVPSEEAVVAKPKAIPVAKSETTPVAHRDTKPIRLPQQPATPTPVSTAKQTPTPTKLEPHHFATAAWLPHAITGINAPGQKRAEQHASKQGKQTVAGDDGRAANMGANTPKQTPTQKQSEAPTSESEVAAPESKPTIRDASPVRSERRTATRSKTDTAANIAQRATSPAPQGEQDMMRQLTEIVRQNPQGAMLLFASLSAFFLIFAGGLVLFAVKFRRRETYVAPESNTTIPTTTTTAVTTTRATTQTQTQGRDRRAGKSRRREERRTASDLRREGDRRERRERRKQHVPVPFERRSGLARRRSDLVDGGVATVASDALDPIAEADVYLACGRYDHAEGTLKEAIASNPSRHEIKIKLLQIYHQRGKITAFNTLAEELHSLTNGESAELLDKLEANGWELDEQTVSSNVFTAGAASEPETIPWDPPAKKRFDRSPPPDLDSESAVPGATSDTLKETFADYLVERGIKSRTADDYARIMATAFEDWQDASLQDISARMVAKRYEELNEERGKAYATRTMRFLRALYNFAEARYKDNLENPVKSLTEI